MFLHIPPSLFIFSKFSPSFQLRTFRTPQSVFYIQLGSYQHESRSPSTFTKLHQIISLVTKAAVRKTWLLAAQEVHHGHLGFNSSIPGAPGTFRDKEYSQQPETMMNVQTFGHQKSGYRLKKKKRERGCTNTWGLPNKYTPQDYAKSQSHKVSCCLHNPFHKTFLL